MHDSNKDIISVVVDSISYIIMQELKMLNPEQSFCVNNPFQPSLLQKGDTEISAGRNRVEALRAIRNNFENTISGVRYEHC